MNPPKLLFDECISRRGIEVINGLSKLMGPGYDVQVAHVLDHQGQGEWDEVWIPKRAQEGWTVISQDRGKGGISKGGRLPDICATYGMTHILLGNAVTRRKNYDKICTLIFLLREIVAIAQHLSGKRFVLEARGPEPWAGKLTERQI